MNVSLASDAVSQAHRASRVVCLPSVSPGFSKLSGAHPLQLQINLGSGFQQPRDSFPSADCTFQIRANTSPADDTTSPAHIPSPCPLAGIIHHPSLLLAPAPFNTSSLSLGAENIRPSIHQLVSNPSHSPPSLYLSPAVRLRSAKHESVRLVVVQHCLVLTSSPAALLPHQGQGHQGPWGTYGVRCGSSRATVPSHIVCPPFFPASSHYGRIQMPLPWGLLSPTRLRWPRPTPLADIQA
jgi:hypothetical protein